MIFRKRFGLRLAVILAILVLAIYYRLALGPNILVLLPRFYGRAGGPKAQS